MTSLLNANKFLKLRLEKPGYTEDDTKCSVAFTRKYCNKQIVFVKLSETNADTEVYKIIKLAY